jgi:hypothetical protein
LSDTQPAEPGIDHARAIARTERASDANEHDATDGEHLRIRLRFVFQHERERGEWTDVEQELVVREMHERKSDVRRDGGRDQWISNRAGTKADAPAHHKHQ